MVRVCNLVRTAAFAVVLAMAMATMTTAISRAQEITPEHLHAAKEAVAASKSTTSLDNILPRLAETAKTQLIANRPDAADQITQIVDEAAISLAPRRGDLEEEVARGYARIFTIEELNQITTFYNTPAGKKLIAETPTVARAIDQAARVWTNGVQRDLREVVTKKMGEAGLQ